MHADGFCTPDTICTLRWTGWTRFARPSRKVWRQLAHPTPRPGLAGQAHAARGQRRGLPPAGRNTKFDGQNSNFCARNLSITGFLPLDETVAGRPGGLAATRVGRWEPDRTLCPLDGHHLHARTGHLGHHLHAFPDTLDTGVHVRTDVQYFCPLLVTSWTFTTTTTITTTTNCCCPSFTV